MQLLVSNAKDWGGDTLFDFSPSTTFEMLQFLHSLMVMGKQTKKKTICALVNYSTGMKITFVVQSYVFV